MSARTDEVAAAEANYLAAWRLLVTHSEVGELVETNDVLFTAVPAPVAYFNSGFVKPPADPVDSIDTIKSFYADRGRPFTIRFREVAGSRTDAACEAAGLAFGGSSPLMVAGVADIAPPLAVDIRRVDSEEMWDEHVAAGAAGFGLPLDLLSALIAPTLLGTDGYIAFNAYVDGEVASTAALMINDDIAGVYNVATPEAFRQQGLGEAVTRAAVAEGAKRGCTLTTLQASDMGFPIYERMGYRTVARWRNFTAE